MKPKRAILFFTILLLALCGNASARAQNLPERDVRIYVKAFAAAKHGDWAWAYHLAAAAHNRLPATVLRWLRYKQEESGASFAEIAAFVKAHPEWPAQNVLRERAEEAIATATDSQLIPWFAAHPPVLPAARLREAQIWMTEGRKQAAVSLIRRTWIEGDFTPAEQKQILQRFRGILREKDNARRLDRLIWAGSFSEAKRLLRLVGPETAALDQARLALAEMKPGVEWLIHHVPARLRNNPGLVYERVRWRRRKGLDDSAAALLERAPADPDHREAWARERLLIARDLLNDHQPRRAYHLAAVSRLSSGATFLELKFLAGWIALRFLREPDTAYHRFVQLYDAATLPISVARGAYWAARAAASMGKNALAKSWYVRAAPDVTTYYGQLAAEHLGNVDLSSMFDVPRPSAAERAAFQRNELVLVARDLAQIGDDDDLDTFLRRVMDEARGPNGYFLAARLARTLHQPSIEVAAAIRASYDGAPLLDEGYPLAKLPPGHPAEAPLILAMTRQESAFDHDAVSGAGALGMMQLMPSTAHRIARRLHLPFSRHHLMNDVIYNLTLGRAYLNSLINDFSGSYVLAIAAYNAGPSRVRQWIQELGDPRSPKVNVIDWIERIPLSETRNYVQRVLENLQIYRMRLGMHAPSFSLASDLKR